MWHCGTGGSSYFKPGAIFVPYTTILYYNIEFLFRKENVFSDVFSDDDSSRGKKVVRALCDGSVMSAKTQALVIEQPNAACRCDMNTVNCIIDIHRQTVKHALLILNVINNSTNI